MTEMEQKKADELERYIRLTNDLTIIGVIDDGKRKTVRMSSVFDIKRLTHIFAKERGNDIPVEAEEDIMAKYYDQIPNLSYDLV